MVGIALSPMAGVRFRLKPYSQGRRRNRWTPTESGPGIRGIGKAHARLQEVQNGM